VQFNFVRHQSAANTFRRSFRHRFTFLFYLQSAAIKYFFLIFDNYYLLVIICLILIIWHYCENAILPMFDVGLHSVRDYETSPVHKSVMVTHMLRTVIKLHGNRSVHWLLSSWVSAVNVWYTVPSSCFIRHAVCLPTSLVVRAEQSARRVCLCVSKQLLNEITFDLHIWQADSPWYYPGEVRRSRS